MVEYGSQTGGGAEIWGEDQTGHIIIDVKLDVGLSSGCDGECKKDVEESMLRHGNHAGNPLFTNAGCSSIE